MKLIPISFVIYLILSLGISSAYAKSETSLDIPPTSLSKWYKPDNKRQVWLHTMFRLRREMQAISEYAKQNNSTAIEKWIARLQKDYNKIVDMVPEWEKMIKPRLLSELENFSEKSDFVRISTTLKMIQRTCDDCHTKYQPLVTAVYRSPHYDNVQLKGGEQNFDDSMEELSETVNRILIALDDGYQPIALRASTRLSTQLHDLGESCSSCHKKDEYPRERILGQATSKRLDALQVNISEGKVKDSKKLMGEIAVTVCARCHNTHRIISDLRDALLSNE